ncbi:ATP-binding cassette domain-containing protein [Flavobacteriaceae bacterium TP-CH-4]|uniref:ATP-binding cassette domain-containing protein n=1 Tax=Pelagihabitans pacificus TaxID=2696054 RepID=A0A967AS48_9FLAO|nr:ATP-binding cassette domain-containing protein [Pelagihabitans pacificus]NHF57928.1 ATP-binding cassette domain-containing protein [Pelagihabitans pacificus]
MIVEIDNVELSFDQRKILYGVYLKAERGKVTGIMGRNGSGKTSLLKIWFGSLKAKYSHIRIDGIHQRQKLFKSGKVVFLPQHQLLPTKIRISDAFELFDLDWRTFIEHFESFKKYEKMRIRELSSGELRVVETYLVLSAKKEIIFLDEPFSFVAPVYVEKLKALMARKKKDSVIVVTDHFYRDILEVSDRIYFLKNGYSKTIETEQDLANEGYVLTSSRER